MSFTFYFRYRLRKSFYLTQQRLNSYDKTLTKIYKRQSKLFIILKVLNDKFAC